MAVHRAPPHIHGSKESDDNMAQKGKYDATYKFGNTTVHVIAPDITPEENERRKKEMYKVAWRIWQKIQEREMEEKGKELKRGSKSEKGD